MGLLLVLAACFVVGLIFRTRFGIWSRELVENALLNRIPGYTLLKTVSQRVGGLEEGALFTPGLADLYGSETRTLVFIVEEHDDGRYTVLVPNAPTPTIGTLCVLPRERITPLAAAPTSAFNCFAQWGIGSKQLIAQG